MSQNNFRLPYLDHGFIILRNLTGPTRRTHDPSSSIEWEMTESDLRPFDADDTDPANAARMSFDQTDGDRTRAEDLKLCDYLMRNWHTSPFEMIEVYLEMKLPIFVARQIVRHRTASLNEVSGRYVTLPPEWYIPEVVGGKAPNKKQGQADNLDDREQFLFKRALDNHCSSGYQEYLTSIARGVAPEHARLFLSLNHYTHWLWKQDLHNLFHLLSLRDHEHAQIESQLLARTIDTLLRQQLPELMKLYDKYRRRG